MKTILLFRTSFLPHGRYDYKALFYFAAKSGWRIQIIEHVNAAVQRHWQDNPAPMPDVKKLLELWKPSGCIVECGGASYEPWMDEFKDVPTVYLDRGYSRNDPHAVCVTSDSSEIAKVAAKELLQLGIDNFAYAKWYIPLTWSEERGKVFQSIIRLHGKQCRHFIVPQQLSVGSDIDELTQTLKKLPKPCGIFAANDETAATIIIACDKAGILIPDDIAVIGVDNDEDICEALPVTLTSIEQDFASTALIGAELLKQMLSGDANPTSSKIGVKRIVRRASANGMLSIDRRVAAAIEYIRKNFCERITPSDVAANMGCSSRHALRLFLAARQHSILDEIHLRRIELSKEQLRVNVMSVESIAGLCGYTSTTDFVRVFKRYTSLTPRAWQRQNAIK